MTPLYLDTSALFASAFAADPDHQRAKAMLADEETRMVTSDVVVNELWGLVWRRHHAHAAETVVRALVASEVEIQSVGKGDLLRAIEIAEDYPDQEFPLVDRTSFAVMHRLGLHRVATFDHHFAVYRFGPGLRKAFEIAR